MKCNLCGKDLGDKYVGPIYKIGRKFVCNECMQKIKEGKVDIGSTEPAVQMPVKLKPVKKEEPKVEVKEEPNPKVEVSKKEEVKPEEKKENSEQGDIE